jgi:hypothetical protein
MTPHEFVAKWKKVTLSERSACQQHLRWTPLSRPENEVHRIEWPAETAPLDTPPAPGKNGDSVYRYENGTSKVDIRVGSIHSVKGETHTATLVLETFWHDHNLQTLLPWLDGRQSGGKSAPVRKKDRLKPTYVAMTRPTHLLCLALKRSSVNETDIANLTTHGWRIAEI